LIAPNDDLGIRCRLSPIDPPAKEQTGERRWRKPLERGSQCVVLDHVKPGKYRLTVVPDQGWEANPPLFEKEIQVVPSPPPEPIRVTLPASSIDLTLKRSNGRVEGYVQFAVLQEGRQRACRQGVLSGSYLDDPKPRSEAVHLLAPGKYELRLWDDLHGWVKSAPLHVKPGEIANAGTLTLRPGAAVTGRIVFDHESRLPAAVMLVDSAGVRRYTSLHWVKDAFVFEAKSLWPGRWTAQVVHGEETVMIERPFQVCGVEPVQLHLKGD
jgi:hypothetical protein